MIPSKSRRREAGAFVQVSLKWVARVKRTTRSQRAVVVGLLLHYLSWRAGGSAFECPNAIFECHGVNRKVKRLALIELETVGLIAVKRRGRRAPIVTLLDVTS